MQQEESRKKRVFAKVHRLIATRGIPDAVVAWDPPCFDEVNRPGMPLDVFIARLSDMSVRKYHHHSYLTRYAPLAEVIEAKRGGYREPSVCFDEAQNIGRITFYPAVMRVWEEMMRHAHIVQAALRSWQEEKRMKGLIIDLRRHTGGNTAPFLYGFRKLFAPYTTTFFAESNSPVKRSDKKWLSSRGIVPGKFTTDELYMTHPFRIAVIIGPKTSSAGEVDAAMFYGKPMVKTFGRPSAGNLSGNMNYPILGRRRGCPLGRWELVLTETRYVTTDETYHESETLVPDVCTDSPLSEAERWISYHDPKKRARR